MNKVHMKIDGIELCVPENYTILEAAKEVNIHIPTLCFMKDINEIGCCRMCIAEVKGKRASAASRGQKLARYPRGTCAGSLPRGSKHVHSQIPQQSGQQTPL